MKLLLENWREYISEEKDIDKVAKAVMYDGDEVLLLKRSNYMEKHSGAWDLPGGHLVEGEDIEEGLIREVEEETGLKIADPVELFSRGNTTFYKAVMPEGSVEISNEHTEYKMVSIDNIDDQELSTKYRDAVKEALK